MLRGPGTADTHLHFSYGANCSHAVLTKRGVEPLSSKPAVANHDVGLVFQHRGGFATLMRSDRAATVPVLGTMLQPHGMLYELTNHQLDALCAFETGYSFGTVKITTYGGQQTTASAFYSRPALLLPRPVAPTERYLSLIVEGLRKGGIESIMWNGWLQLRLLLVEVSRQNTLILLRADWRQQLLQQCCVS